jgi:hypothetical protein
MFLRNPTSLRDKLYCLPLTLGDGTLLYSITQSFKVPNEAMRLGLGLLADRLPCGV